MIHSSSDSESDDIEVLQDHRITELLQRQFQQRAAHKARLGPGNTRHQSARATAASEPNTIVRPNGRYELHLGYLKKNETRPPYLLVKDIIELHDGRIMVYGFPMVRTSEIMPKYTQEGDRKSIFNIMTMRINELCFEVKTVAAKPNAPLDEDCLASVPLEAIDRERNIILTNYAFPHYSYMAEGFSTLDARTARRDQDLYDSIVTYGPLCCRWKFVEWVDQTPSNKAVVRTLARLHQGECDPGKGKSDAVLRSEWREQSGRLKATHNDAECSNSAIDELIYTLFDACAGAGGVSRAAKAVGFMLKWLLDTWLVAIETLRYNFSDLPEAAFIQMGVEDFVQVAQNLTDFIVDLLHLSYPCKGHSWLNRGTNPTRDAYHNELGFTLGPLLRITLPRVVTLEQTPHILTKNGGWYFRNIVHELHDSGYSVTWRTFNMMEYSVPSSRTRLIIMACAPGEKMPAWPSPTGRMNINRAIRNIPFDVEDHNIREQKRLHKLKQYKLEEIDRSQPLKHLITTKGVRGLFRHDGELYRPTIAEQKRLMTFPDEHKICGKTQGEKYEQIGNAVPPAFMEQVFGRIIGSLKETDTEEINTRLNALTIDD